MIDDKCIWPGCLQFIKPGSDLCFMHDLKSGAPKMKAAPKPIPVKSKKRIAEDKVYKKIVAEMAALSDRCEIRSQVCTGKMSGLDHIQKRTPNNLLDRNNLKRSCSACNLYKELHPTWANDNGHSKSRFKK